MEKIRIRDKHPGFATLDITYILRSRYINGIFEVERMQSITNYLDNNVQCITTTMNSVFRIRSGSGLIKSVDPDGESGSRQAESKK